METFPCSASDARASEASLAPQLPATAEEMAAALAAIATYLDESTGVELPRTDRWRLAGWLEAHGDSSGVMARRLGWKR